MLRSIARMKMGAVDDVDVGIVSNGVTGDKVAG